MQAQPPDPSRGNAHVASTDAGLPRMKTGAFLTNVRERADLESSDEARAATEATLRVLGSRLTESEAENLAAQLPEEFGASLTWESGTEPEGFDAETFFERVRQQEAEDNRIDDADGRGDAKAVGSVIAEAVSEGEISDVLAQLPDEYTRLFDPPEGAI